MTSEPHARSKRVLAALVREYIASGEPVASSVLVTAAGLGVSSATVRSILARLEDEGFVPGWRMKVTMTCDHRVIDGATGAAFLQTLRTYVESPWLLLV